MELKLEIFEYRSFFSFTTTVRLITRTSRRERNCNNVSHSRISTADSIGFVCVPGTGTRNGRYGNVKEEERRITGKGQQTVR